MAQVRKDYPLSGRWIYVNTFLGCAIVATNGKVLNVPAGFFALNRDEIQEYFTNNYLTVVYDDSDSYFNVFSYDFAINSVQPLSDLTSVMTFNRITDLYNLVNEVKNNDEIIANYLSILTNAYINNNAGGGGGSSDVPILDLGSINGKYSFDAISQYPRLFTIVLPSSVSSFTKFKGTVKVPIVDTVTNTFLRVDNGITKMTFDTALINGVLSYTDGIGNMDYTFNLGGGHKYYYDFRDSSGNKIDGVTISDFFVSPCKFNGSVGAKLRSDLTVMTDVAQQISFWKESNEPTITYGSNFVIIVPKYDINAKWTLLADSSKTYRLDLTYYATFNFSKGV